MAIWIFIFLYLLIAEAFVYFLSFNGNPQDKKIDIIVVLGANGNLHSHHTRDRALNATLAKAQYPEAKILLTGNELKGEISTYKELFTEHGHMEFLTESKSTTTWENFKFSKILLEKISNHTAKILIVTSEYHQKRSLAMARCLGYESYIFGKDTRKYKKSLFFFLKERFSVAKYFPQMLFSYLKFRF